MNKSSIQSAKRIAAALVLTGGMLLTGAASAQITGELVEPDVMLLIDSSGSMDWLRETGQRDTGRWDWSRKVCIDSSLSTDPSTGWHKVQDAFLGSAGSDGRCSVEPYYMRPNMAGLSSDVWTAEGYLSDDDGDGVTDYIEEFRISHRPHFRRVNCPEENWHKHPDGEMYQCIKLVTDDNYIANSSDPNFDPDVDGPYTTVSYFTATEEQKIYCRIADVVNGMCWNYHPAAQERLGNGILTRYSSMARFGIMTYDNKPNCLTGTPSAPCDPHETWWDYGDSRVWEEYLTGGYWNAGARSDHPAAIGGLVRIGLTADATNQQVRDVFETMEPLNCSPIGALVDDAGYYLATDPYVRPFGMTIDKQDPLVSVSDYTGKDRYYKCRPKIVVMVTDGDPGALEWPAGSCNVTNTDDDWDPQNTNAATTVFDCPWRSTPEEAWELFDVGSRTLDQLLADLGDVQAEEDQPVYLVVVGFNVTEDCADVQNDPNCSAMDPECQQRLEKCADCTCELTGDPVADAECEEKRSRCIEYTSGYNDKVCYVATCPEGETCLMTPREFLNEIACQGWPWNTPMPGGAGGHLAELPPPWLDPDLDSEETICADPTPANPYPICTLTRGDKTKTKGDRALFVNDATDLATVLDMVIGSLSSTVATRTDVVTWNVPTVAGPGIWPGVTEIAGQYEFNSGYVAKQGRPWQGILVRTPYECTEGPDPAQRGTPSNIGAQLANQTERDLYVLKEEELDAEDYLPLNGTANAQDWIDSSLFELVELSSSELDDCAFADSEVDGFCTDTHELQGAVSTFMEDRGLADIFNSTPSVLGPPTDRLGIPSHDLFRTEQSSRHPFLFVGTNDGVMHAFDITQMQDSENGSMRVEAFGYVPRALLPQLWRQFPIDIDRNETGYDIRTNEDAGLYQHLYLMDGSPVTRDVLLFRDPTKNNPSQEKSYWRSIVLGGLGKGVRGYYALDVTGKMSSANAPATADMLRWELSPAANMWGNNEDAQKDALNEMGYPLAKPAIAYVNQQIGDGSEVAQVAAAILPGGWNSDASPDGNTGVYIVRLADGQLIRYLRPGALGDADMCAGSSAGLKEDPNDEDAVIESAQLLGEPVIPYSSDMVTSTNEAFIGDDRGRLWRIDMTDPNPDNWCLSIFFDTMLAWDYPYEDCDLSCTPPEGESCCAPSDACYHDDCCTGFTEGKSCAADPDAPSNMDAPRTMIVGAPTIAENDEGKNVIIFGTGQYDGLSSWNRNRIFSISDDTEEVEIGAEDTDTPSITVEVPVINWWIGDDLVATSDEDWTQWHAQLREELADARVDHEFTGTSGESFWNIGEKLVGAPVVFNEVAYFTTFVPIENPDLEDACEAGGSRIWGVDYDNRKGPNGEVEASFEQDDFGRFTDEDGEHSMFRWFPDDLLSGVRVVSRPRCTTGFDTDVFELAVQKAQKDFKQYDNKQVPSDAIQTQREELAQGGNLLEISILRFDSWAIIFE